eukprot:GILJ01027999.1.p1 GENE.GILJ01027999.1~~GILJ01027999.1.p1  ORF type:complete len:411 (-),score=54.57 GILJ01027999.1:34-1209(-)
MAEQIADIKQIIMYREKLYQERIRRLEARVEQLSEFALQIARSSSQTNVMGAIPSSMVATTAPVEAPKAAEALEDDELGGGVEGILKKYRSKIDAVYDYYTATSTQVASPCMTLTHFSKLLRDCNLSGFEQAEPSELLWMAVIRKLHAKKRRDPNIGYTRSMIVSQHGRSKTNHESFSYERLDEITKSEFPSALLHLAMEKVGRWQPDATQEATLEAFLLRDVFPHTDRALERVRVAGAAHIGGDVSVANISIDEYRTENVKALIKKNIGSLKKTFSESIRAVQSLKDGDLMTIEGFVELIRRHDLLSAITKTDLRYIFITCAQVEKAANPSAFETAKSESITVASLPRVVYHLADRIYGDPLFVTQFPTPEARVEKLLAKMFLLFDNRAR